MCLRVSVENVERIEDPDEVGMGPAMLKLLPMQRRFVIGLIEFQGNQTRAARAAGYSTGGESGVGIRVHGWRLAHDERIQAALHEVCMKMMKAGSVDAVQLLLSTMADPAVERKDRLKAAEMLMNRTGLHPTSEHKVAVTHKDETGDELIKQIEQLAKGLGVDPRKLLGGAPAVIEEAVFEEVKAENAEDDLSDIY